VRSIGLLLSALLLTLATACGPDVTRGANGWKVAGAPYSVQPVADGGIMPQGWKLTNAETAGDGFRRSQASALDLEIRRTEDDGILVVATEGLAEDGVGKKLQVLAERWLKRVVIEPQDDDSGNDAYADVVPPIVKTTRMQVGLRSGSAEALNGRSVQTVRQEDFSVPGGGGYELDAQLVPAGAPGPDRRLYLAVLRGDHEASRVVVVAYANTPGMFDAGAAGAADLAHRMRF
jgi:hypothetical protein